MHVTGAELPSFKEDAGRSERVEDGGGGPAGARLAVHPPGSPGSGFQLHQELCWCTKGPEGNALQGRRAGCWICMKHHSGQGLKWFISTSLGAGKAMSWIEGLLGESSQLSINSPEKPSGFSGH